MSPPKVSPVTGKSIPSTYLHASSAHFQDTHGRSVLLRGVNLSGASKAPIGSPSWKLENFWEDAEEGNLDFRNRPLNLDDGSADVHLARLRAWGFNMLRFVFTWEAIEHAGPGKYDEKYMDYVVECLRKCKEWGFRVFMDPHQDVWSRFSGGSGAPLWTLYACGIDPRHMSETYGALIHCEYPDKINPQPSTFPGMIWGTNYTRLVSQTVFTMFFAGKEFTPKCIINGKNIQDFLQDHFLGAVAALAKKLQEAEDLYEDCVIGWDSMNEPGEGLVGHPDVGKMSPETQLKKGPMPSPLEGMKLGMGEAQDVDDWYFSAMGPAKQKKVRLDPKGVKLWLDKDADEKRGAGRWGWKRDEGWKLNECVWAQHGIWNSKEGTILRPSYFYVKPKTMTKYDFVQDFWTPHFIAYAKMIRSIHSEAILFLQTPVFKKPPTLPPNILSNRACSSPHFYDGLTLMTKHWNWFNADALGVIRHKYWSIVQAVRVGDTAIKSMMQDELSIFNQDTRERLGDYPTLVGEIGCPYDMDERKAYGYADGGRGEGDYSMQRRAWDASMNAMDGANAMNFTLWTYVPDSSHEWGDLWNGEDLSLWNADDLEKHSDDSPNITTNPVGDPAQPKSLASSLTLPPPSDPSDPPMISSSKVPANLMTYTPEQISLGQFPPSLLLDGSRAIEAINRPYPISIIGTPQRFDFDMHTSTFKFSVRVSSMNEIDSTNQQIATEIYLPFVHFSESLEGGAVPYINASTNDSKVSLIHKSSSSTSLKSLKSGLASKVHIHPVRHPKSVDLETTSTTSSTSSSFNHHGVHIPHPHLPHARRVRKKTSKDSLHPDNSIEEPPEIAEKADIPIVIAVGNLELSLDVQISTGRIETKGQILRWYYDIPNQGEVTYNMVVKRKGGPIKKLAMGYGNSGSWADVIRMAQSLTLNNYL